MDWLRKLPGFQRSPHGLEWKILRLMPTACIAGTLLPLGMSGLARVLLTANNAAELARHVQLFDYAMVGLVILIWTLIATVTIGCVVVWLMKGPAYVADAMEVSHSDKPRSD